MVRETDRQIDRQTYTLTAILCTHNEELTNYSLRCCHHGEATVTVDTVKWLVAANPQTKPTNYGHIKAESPDSLTNAIVRIYRRHLLSLFRPKMTCILQSH